MDFKSIVLLSGLFACVAAHGDANGNGFHFVGEEHWGQNQKDQCERPVNQPYKNPELKCHSYYIYFQRVNIEVLSTDPILFVYRDFASSKEIKSFLSDVESKELEVQKVVSNTDGGNEYSTTRRANGTWLLHEEMSGVGRMYQKARTLIPHINFRSGESWQVLSYLPGGHYSPHYDHLFYTSEDHYDWWMKQYGNRMATFLLVLKTADIGGATVFPHLQMTVQPQAGDVIFWYNMDAQGNRADLSLHGACPIVEGRKIAATIWIRVGGQDLLSTTDGDRRRFDVTRFTNPRPLPQSRYGFEINGIPVGV